nr:MULTISPECIES: ABC transporter ATP-binding protein [unclassified Gemella]
MKNTYLILFITNIIALLIVVMSLYQPQYIVKLIENYSNIKAKDFLYIILFIFAIAILNSIKFYSTKVYSERIFENIREYIYRKLLETKIDNVSNLKKGEILSIISADARILKDSLATILMDIPGAIVLFSGSIYYLIKINMRLFFIMIAFLFLSIAISIIFSLLLKKYTIYQQESFANFITVFEKYLDKLLIIKALWLQKSAEKKFKSTSKDIYNSTMKVTKIQALMTPISNLLFQLFILGLIFVFTIFIKDGSMSVEELSLFLMYSTFFVLPLSTIVNSVGGIGMILAAKVRIDKICMDLEEEELDKKDKINRLSKCNENIVDIKNASFAYGDNYIFKNLNLSVTKGGLSVIIGQSGKGKTTLVNLILGLFKLNEGQIILGDRNIEEYDLEYLRSKVFCYCPQDIFEWGDTIRESLLLEAQVDTSIVEYWLEILNLKKFIESLPKGLDMEIGSLLKKASTGELQRLSLARSFIRGGEIYIFDEPTSNLDKENEEIVNNILKDLSKRKTVIVVSHRQSILKLADSIITLDN